MVKAADAITEHWTQKVLASIDTFSMWPVLHSSKSFFQWSHCDHLPLVTTSPGLPYPSLKSLLHTARWVIMIFLQDEQFFNRMKKFATGWHRKRFDFKQEWLKRMQYVQVLPRAQCWAWAPWMTAATDIIGFSFFIILANSGLSLDTLHVYYFVYFSLHFGVSNPHSHDHSVYNYSYRLFWLEFWYCY